MNAGGRTRIAVWLDPTAPQEASLKVLTGLGTATEILGFFVEDVNLLGFSRLSVAREISFEGAVIRQMDQQSIEQQFQAHATRMRGLFETAARKARARHSFRVARGELRAELLKVSADCDVLVLAHSRQQLGPRLTIRAQLGELLVSGPRTLVLVQEQWSTGQRIVAVFDGSESGESALRVAAAIARSEGLNLSVWLPDVSEDRLRELEGRTVELLSDDPTPSFRTLPVNDLDELVRAAQTERARVLVLPGAEPDETQRLVAGLLDRVSCSLIVAR